jgi:hypothetical protein
MARMIYDYTREVLEELVLGYILPRNLKAVKIYFHTGVRHLKNWLNFFYYLKPRA